MEPGIEDSIQHYILSHQGLIERLKTYKESGYRKIEPLSGSPATNNDQTTLLSILMSPMRAYYLIFV